MQTRSAPHTIEDTQEDREAGFSLLEIMISITILGLLATIVVINVLPAQVWLYDFGSFRVFAYQLVAGGGID